MRYEIAVQSVLSRRVAVVRERLRWTDLGKRLIPLLDRVYVAVRAGKVVQSGQNIFIYRDGSQDSVAVEAGVQVSERFEAVGDVFCAETPEGEAAVTAHIGPYSGLGVAHQAVIRWCGEHGRKRAGVWWEVYGDWQEDPAKLETEVYYLLQPVRP
ncbi:MAG: AraC family transcriptional regulator [Acidobacteria bacterium]|nr:MAG: AraC family transcriptional regulator [Acidobacteriota bacterium]